MRTIILAAGRGSRLQRLTEDRPKCLVELAGHSLLHWQLEALREAGIRDIWLVRGYRKELLAGTGYAVIDNPRWAETNMVATLTCAAGLLVEAPALVAYADIVYHPSIIRTLSDAQGDIAITYDRGWNHLWRERFVNPLADAETLQTFDGKVTAIGQPAQRMDEIEGQYMGLLRFTPVGWQAVQWLLETLSNNERDQLDMTGLLMKLVRNGFPVEGIPVEGRWCEVDSEADLELYSRRVGEVDTTRFSWQHDWRW